MILGNILLRFVLFIVYLSIGMVSFMAIEGPHQKVEAAKSKENQEELRLNTTRRFNMTNQEFENFVARALDAFQSPTEWSYKNSFAFVLQTVTTIGYGTITPQTTGGRMFCIFYALFGIPVAALLLQATGKAQYKAVSGLIKRIETGCLGRESVSDLEAKCVFFTFVQFCLVVLISGGFYKAAEGPFLEGVYAYFITYTTIGYGDIVPGEHSKSAGWIWLRLVLMIIGLSFASSVLNSIGSYLEKREQSRGCMGCCPERLARCAGFSASSPRSYYTGSANEVELDGGVDSVKYKTKA